jgi:hypothetical protein
MEYKLVSVSGDLTVPVPVGLSAEEEAQYVASRIAFVDLERLKADSLELLKAWEEGTMVPMEAVLAELKQTAGKD